MSMYYRCILFFFVLRLATSASRVFRSPRGGFGEWGGAAEDAERRRSGGGSLELA